MPRNPDLYRQITERTGPSSPSETRKPDATPSSPGRLEPPPTLSPSRELERIFDPLIRRPSGS
jgi:hypothetical protein